MKGRGPARSPCVVVLPEGEAYLPSMCDLEQCSLFNESDTLICYDPVWPICERFHFHPEFCENLTMCFFTGGRCENDFTAWSTGSGMMCKPSHGMMCKPSHGLRLALRAKHAISTLS